MKLIIDIGNTVAKLVAFDGEEPIEEIKTNNDTLAALPAFASKYHFDCGIVGSVIGIPDAVEDILTSMPFPILRFTPDTPIPICNKYKTPHTLGSDRLAAAVGASILKPGKDILIIDAGTCITYDVIDAKKNYWGGMGYNTETAIRSGVLRGMKYEIEGYIKSMRAKYPNLLVFLTGGDKINFDTNIKNSIFADKFIVPRGLNKILDYNYDKIQ